MQVLEIHNFFLNTFYFLSTAVSKLPDVETKDMSELIIELLSFAGLGLLGIFAFFLFYSLIIRIVRSNLPLRSFGLIGYPLGHSFSKKYFTEKFKAEKVNAQYSLFEIPQIEDVKTVLKHDKLRGLNVTIPYKEQVLAFLDEIDPVAQDLGAVNVIRVEKKNNSPYLKGYNTDLIGFEKSIEKKINPSHLKALILGTGGAAKAIEYVLKKRGIKVCFVSRKAKKGTLDYEMLDEETISTHTLIVNATPLGTYPDVDACPDIPYEFIGDKHLLFDVVYNPAETLFMKKGKAQGATVLNGEEMLIEQAEAAWAIWNE